MAQPHRFVTDSMLGKLARWLRAMGYDTLYFRVADDRHLLEVARREGRVLLTRDGRLARLASPAGLLIRPEKVEAQIIEVIEGFTLTPRGEDFLSRCMECNAELLDRPKESVKGLVPDYIFARQEGFAGCPDCGRIYWQGSHADRILARLGRVLGSGPPTV